MPSVPQKLRSLYFRFDRNLLLSLDDVYSADIQFKDPLHAINGLPALTHYYEGMMKDLIECRFEFHHSIEHLERGEAVLFWTMHYRHKKIKSGKLLQLTGNTHILYKDKVYYHRDYFDAGALLYEHVPILGMAINYLKRKLGAK
jgi:hypothetical protein